MSDRYFRFSIDVQPPEGADLRDWNGKFMAAILVAMRDLDGSMLVDENFKPCLRVKELTKGSLN